MKRADKDFLVNLLSENSQTGIERIFAEAKKIRNSISSNIVYMRGLLEISNKCRKDCYYCGIRAGNRNQFRYEMDSSEIFDICRWALRQGIGSIVLQSGERKGIRYVRWIEHLVRGISELSKGQLRITLALGEQDPDVYKRWRDAGATRYLLRIETSSRSLYRAWHPAGHSFERRRSCLADLKALGYQVGSGVLIGLPGQNEADLAEDILFFRDMDIDMIGMGPYLYHPCTPLGRKYGIPDRDKQLMLGLKMIAASRIFLKDVNIASTTALEALSPNGREMGINSGANVVMPNLTPARYRADYCLYEGKPGTSSSAVQSLKRVMDGIRNSGCTVGIDIWGDSPHFSARQKRGRSENKV